MLEPITLEEVLELVTFANLDGKWVIRDVLSDVWGDVRADVLGPCSRFLSIQSSR